MPAIQGPRGAPDILFPRSHLHEQVARVAEDAFRRYGCLRVDTPAFEHTELFVRGLEGGSDLVTKEMYTFEDKGGRSFTLRPEGTAPVVRAVLEHSLQRQESPLKLYYTAPMFRHERPQAGRQRQFLQVGVEALGSPGPSIDAEVVSLGAEVLSAAGLPATLKLNSIGHPGCRAGYLPALRQFLEGHRDELCQDCRRKIDHNPLRTFDCKVEADRAVMRGAPLISDHLCAECRAHFEEVQRLLGALGVAFELDPRLVRGLDYYTRTTFAYTASGLGSQNEVGGGGRYDGLSVQIGGDPLPGIGFALGVDRIALALEAGGSGAARQLDVYVAAAADAAREAALLLAGRLRRGGLGADLDHGARGLRAQFKAAARAGARRVVVIGERELSSGTYTVRDMESGAETSVGDPSLVDYLRAGG